MSFSVDSDEQGYGVKGFGSIVCLDLWPVMTKDMIYLKYLCANKSLTAAGFR